MLELIYNFLVKADEYALMIVILFALGVLCIIIGIFILMVVGSIWNYFTWR